MTAVLELSAVEQAALVRSGELSARELVEASLQRIERLNPTVNAFVALDPERALAEADAIAAGDPRSLCGVPIGVKDLLSATEGLPTTEGSAGFGDWVADHDTAHVRRLREAGAIVVGKTSTPELGVRPVTESSWTSWPPPAPPRLRSPDLRGGHGHAGRQLPMPPRKPNGCSSSHATSLLPPDVTFAPCGASDRMRLSSAVASSSVAAPAMT